MILDELRGCCGIGELYDLDWTECGMVQELFDAMPLYEEQWGVETSNPKNPYGMIVFTDNIKFLGGKELAKFIRNKGLGRLVNSPVVGNPNHPGNKIMMWTWYPNYNKLRRMKKTLDKG